MTWETGTEEMTCAECGAVHDVAYQKIPVREVETLRCQGCGAILRESKSTRSYSEPKLRAP